MEVAPTVNVNERCADCGGVKEVRVVVAVEAKMHAVAVMVMHAGMQNRE